MSRAQSSGPEAWLLCDDRPGNVTQAVGLAEALGLSFVHKQLCFRDFARREVPVTRALLLGAFGWPTRIGVDPARSDALAPPWPRLIIAAGGRCAPVARWIRARSRGATRVILLGRKAALCTAWVELAIAPRTARLPADPRRIETLAPLHRVHRERLAAAAEAYAPFQDAPRPRIALIVGGTAGRYRFGAAEATELVRHVLGLTARSGGSLFVTTSRRTGEEASAALVAALGADPCVRVFHRFRAASAENPYFALLGGADALVVTCESESMLAEAASTGRPVFVARLPERAPTRRRRVREAIAAAAERRQAGRGGWSGLMASALVSSGLALPPRDLARLHDALIGLGIAQHWSDSSAVAASVRVAPLDESSRVAAEVRQRLGP